MPSGSAATTRPAPPPRLSHFECANAARNCAENFGEQQAREWLEHRNLALSEMCLKGTPLLKSLLFESLPLWMGGPLCMLVEGPLAASNRGLNVFHGCTLAKLPTRVLYFVVVLAFLDSQVQQRSDACFSAFRSELFPKISRDPPTHPPSALLLVSQDSGMKFCSGKHVVTHSIVHVCRASRTTL
jgi:hypothetical protein